ncbi:MAG: Ada metal-binding domain-containing protein [Ilumatobacteraceae bacterium]
MGSDGNPHPSTIPGTLGGHRRTKIFGQLDCPSALRAITRGGYVDHRVFFPDADTAQLAGYRPCATCKPDAYREWKTNINVHQPIPLATRADPRAGDNRTSGAIPADTRSATDVAHALNQEVDAEQYGSHYRRGAGDDSSPERFEPLLLDRGEG